MARRSGLELSVESVHRHFRADLEPGFAGICGTVYHLLDYFLLLIVEVTQYEIDEILAYRRLLRGSDSQT